MLEYLYITEEFYETVDLKLIGKSLLDSARIKFNFSNPEVKVIDPRKDYFKQLLIDADSKLTPILQKALEQKLLIVGIIEKTSTFDVCPSINDIEKNLIS